FKNAYVTKTVQKSAVVRVFAVGGAVGLGNIDPSPGYSTETIDKSLDALRTRLAPAAVGLDASNIHALTARLDAVLPGFFEAKAAIEMACVDLTARRLGVPVYTYLGGAVKTRLTFNAWIGILPPEEAAAEALKWHGRGFRSAKIKVGGNIDADRERVRAVRAAVGSRCGIGHGFGLGVSTMAEIMLAATSVSVIDGLECVGPLKTTDDIVTSKLDLTSGAIDLPRGPGLGVTLDEEKLARYRYS